MRCVLVACLIVLSAAGMTGKAAADNADLTVFAAASLKNALDAVDAQWRKQGGEKVVAVYAASSTLAKQIENGAPADLFISADLKWMDYLQERGLIRPKTRVDLLGNSLVLIAPKDSAVRASIGPGFPISKLLGNGRLAMADPRSVPAGIYGKAALEKLGVWPSVAGHIAAAPNVRAALFLVARGEAPLGIVYKTDAAVEPGVKIVGVFPPDSHPPIVYPMALTRSAAQGATQYEAFLQGPTARAIFGHQGFTPLGPGRAKP